MKKLTHLTLVAGLLAVGSTALAQYSVYIPTNVAGAKMSYVVQDMLLW